jgi:hypothetical protein
MMRTSRPAPAYFFAALLLPVGLAIAAWPAAAQSNTSSAPLSAEETRQCICLDAAITRIRGNADRVQALDNEYNQLTAQLDQLRTTMDVYDKAQVDNFRQIYDQRTAVRQELQVPGSGLKGLINRHNAMCAGRAMFAMNVEAARAQCPAQP